MLGALLLAVFCLLAALSGSADAGGTNPGTAPLFIAGAGNKSIHLSWDLDGINPADREVIVIYQTGDRGDYPTDPDDGYPVLNGNGGYFPASVTAYNHTRHTSNGVNIANGQRFYYALFITDGAGGWSARLVTQARAGDSAPPPPLTAFEARAGDRWNLLRWTAPDDADYHAVMIRYQTGSYPVSPDSGTLVENGANGIFVGEPGVADSFTHKNLVNGEKYWYAAFAVDFSNNIETGGAHAAAQPVDGGAPAEVSDFTIEARDGELVLRWTNPPDPDFFGTLIRFSDERIVIGLGDGEPVPGGMGGFFEAQPASPDSFVHTGLVPRKTYYYSAFTVDQILNYSEGVGFAAVPLDKTPPDLTVGVLQNPYLTALIDLVLVSSEPLAGEAIELLVDSTAVAMTSLDGRGLAWKGDYRLTAAGTVEIRATGADSSGNVSSTAADFSAAEITPGGGGKVVSPGGRLALRIPRDVVAKNEYVIVLPVEAGEDVTTRPGPPGRAMPLKRLGTSPAVAWTVSPAGLLDGAEGELSISYEGTSLASEEPDRIVIVRRGKDVPLETYVDDVSHTASAAVRALGTFALEARGPGSSFPVERAFIRLVGNRPNPFNPITRIEYSLSRESRVRLDVYDVEGRWVATLVDGVAGAGTYQATWSGTTTGDRPVASGVYFARLEAEGRTAVRKMILMR